MKPVIKKLLAVLGLLAAVTIGSIILNRIFGTVCLFKALTGYPCPGCGMTRAWWSVLRGDITDAFYWHPLFLLAPVLVGAIAVYTFAKKPLPRKIAEITLLVLAAAFIIVWIIRLVNGWR